MKNQKPILITGFSRGGSNLVLNLLRSSSQVCSPRGETHQVLKGKSDEPTRIKFIKKLRALPIVMATGRSYFSLHNLNPRPPIPGIAAQYLDHIFYKEKFRARDVAHRSGEPRPSAHLDDSGVSSSRLLLKNLDGLILASKAFYKIWPDLTFVFVVRHSVPLIEGKMRRGHNLNDSINLYNRGVEEILKLNKKLPLSLLLKFEQITADPAKAVDRLYSVCKLHQPKYFQLQLKGAAKKILTGNNDINDKQEVMVKKDELKEYILPGLNKAQAGKLNTKITKEIINRTAPNLRALGYKPV